jgi:hypothetical protein
MRTHEFQLIFLLYSCPADCEGSRKNSYENIRLLYSYRPCFATKLLTIMIMNDCRNQRLTFRHILNDTRVAFTAIPPISIAMRGHDRLAYRPGISARLRGHEEKDNFLMGPAPAREFPRRRPSAEAQWLPET